MANNNNNIILNVPNLRFPEFTGEWKRTKISDLLEFFSTNSLSWEQLDYENGKIRNLHYGLIHKGLPTMVDLSKETLPFVKGEAPRNYTICKDGDVAFADASEDTNDVAKAIEFINCNNEDVICGLHSIHGRDKTKSTIVGYKGYAFASFAFHKQIRRITQGTKIYSISTKNFNETYVGVPSIEEQTKIARLLFLIDERISTQNKIIEDFKKLMSAIIDLFYTTGNQCCKLSDLIIQTSERNNGKTNNAVLSVSNKNGFVLQNELFEDRIIASDDTSNYKIVQLNDFAYNPARINVGSIARLSEYNEGIVSPMYICFKTNKLVLSEFLEQFFKTRYFYQEMIKRLEGSVRLCLSYESLCDISMPLLSIETQNKIQKRINTILSKINIETCVLKNLELEKSFLLQQMFI